MVRYRIVIYCNGLGEDIYRVQRKYFFWPFWFFERFMIHPDLPDPIIEYRTIEEAKNHIENNKRCERYLKGPLERGNE